MRADEVVEEEQHGNQVVGGSKGCKPLFRFVPGLELLRTEVKNGDKSGFAVRNEPEVVFAAPDIHHGMEEQYENSQSSGSDYHTGR